MADMSSAFVAPNHKMGFSNCKRGVGVAKNGRRNIDYQPLCVRGGGVATTGPLQVIGFVGDFATAGVTGGIGDYIAQLLEHSRSSKTAPEAAQQHHFEHDQQMNLIINEQPKPKPKFSFDGRRTVAYAAFAGIYSGAFQHLWFHKLHQAFPNPTVQLAINQGLIIPMLYYPLFLWMVPKLRARSKQEKIELRSKIDVKSMIPKNWAFWVPLQFIQFRFLPASLQVAYCSICGLVWKIILSWLTAGSTSNAKNQQKDAALPPTVLNVGTLAKATSEVKVNQQQETIVPENNDDNNSENHSTQENIPTQAAVQTA